MEKFNFSIIDGLNIYTFEPISRRAARIMMKYYLAQRDTSTNYMDAVYCVKSAKGMPEGAMARLTEQLRSRNN